MAALCLLYICIFAFFVSANPYEYRHEDGIYYTFIEDDLIIGSQPQNADDVRRIHREEGVTAILNMQQDKDIAYWGIDYNELQRAAKEEGVCIRKRAWCHI